MGWGQIGKGSAANSSQRPWPGQRDGVQPGRVLTTCVFPARVCWDLRVLETCDLSRESRLCLLPSTVAAWLPQGPCPAPTISTCSIRQPNMKGKMTGPDAGPRNAQVSSVDGCLAHFDLSTPNPSQGRGWGDPRTQAEWWGGVQSVVPGGLSGLSRWATGAWFLPTSHSRASDVP